MNPGLFALLLCFAVFDSAILAPLLIFRRMSRRKKKREETKGNRRENKPSV